MEMMVRLFKKLRIRLHYLDNEQIEKIYQAYLMALEAHREQKRSSGEPYITHPVAVACILADMHMDAQSLMAALLHDVIEDTGISKEAIATQFGQSVAELVDGVSKLTQIEFKSRAEAQAENFRKMVLAMSRDIRVMIVKLADRLHNMRTLGILAGPKRRRIARETLEIFAPIANRLGMHAISTELENLGFEALYPQRFQILRGALRRVRGDQKKILSLIDKSLHEGLAKGGLQKFQVIGREKHVYSIYKKMRQKGHSFHEIMDVYGFRIIVTDIDDCYRALGIVHGLFKPLPERFKDYIAIPKANGYQSLHTSLFGPFGVPIEVQIRTKEMDDMANSGIAAHWLYKSGENNTDESQLRAQQWVQNLLEMQQKTGNSLEFIENVKIDLFPDEVYVFTPKGAIMELPGGATAVDFAYAVHTDIGDTCVAVKIDRQLAPLSTVLKSGQTVEVITSAAARPNPSWLDFVVTAKARSGIRHYLKTQRRTESIALGKQLLSKALGAISLSIKKIPQTKIHTVLQEAQLAEFDDLLEQIGMGDRVATLVAHQLAGAAETEIISEEKLAEAKPLLIKGTEGMVISFASCCNPIPGDPIVGILSPGHGIVVHTEQCKKISKQRQHSERVMNVNWSQEVQGDFLAQIKVIGVNQRGVLAKLAQAIANADANIDDIVINERDIQNFTITIKMQVRNRGHLAQVIRAIRNLNSIVRVTRGK